MLLFINYDIMYYVIMYNCFSSKIKFLISCNCVFPSSYSRRRAPTASAKFNVTNVPCPGVHDSGGSVQLYRWRWWRHWRQHVYSCTLYTLYTLCHPPPAMSTGWMEMFNYTPRNDEQLDKLAIILK